MRDGLSHGLVGTQVPKRKVKSPSDSSPADITKLIGVEMDIRGKRSQSVGSLKVLRAGYFGELEGRSGITMPLIAIGWDLHMHSQPRGLVRGSNKKQDLVGDRKSECDVDGGGKDLGVTLPSLACVGRVQIPQSLLFSMTAPLDCRKQRKRGDVEERVGEKYLEHSHRNFGKNDDGKYDDGNRRCTDPGKEEEGEIETKDGDSRGSLELDRGNESDGGEGIVVQARHHRVMKQVLSDEEQASRNLEHR